MISESIKRIMFRSLNCLFALFVGTKNRKSYERSLVKKSAMRYTVLRSSVHFLSWEKEYVHGKISREKTAVRIFTRERTDYIAHDLLTIPANDTKNSSRRFLEREIGWKKQNTQTGMRMYFSRRHCRWWMVWLLDWNIVGNLASILSESIKSGMFLWQQVLWIKQLNHLRLVGFIDITQYKPMRK